VNPLFADEHGGAKIDQPHQPDAPEVLPTQRPGVWWKWRIHSLMQVKGPVMLIFNGAQTLFDLFREVDTEDMGEVGECMAGKKAHRTICPANALDDSMLVMVLVLWLIYGVVLTGTVLYLTKPHLAGTSNYYHNMVKMGAGCGMSGQYRYLYMAMILGKLVTLGIAVYGIVVAFVYTHHPMSITTILTFVAVNFYSIYDIPIRLPEANKRQKELDEAIGFNSMNHDQRLSNDIFPPGYGRVPLYFDEIEWYWGAREAISSNNYMHAIRCDCLGRLHAQQCGTVVVCGKLGSHMPASSTSEEAGLAVGIAMG